MYFRVEIVRLLETNGVSDAEALLEIPPDSSLGDYALPCFTLAKQFKKAPASIAQELASRLSCDFATITAVGPYINFTIQPNMLATTVVQSANNIYELPKQHKKVLIEYPSPNTNKPLHLGHVRNMVLGSTMALFMRHESNTTLEVNLNNDRGVHICKSMLAYHKWGNDSEPDKKPDHFVGDWYVKFEQEKKNHPELEDEAQQMLIAWENHDPAVRALWKRMNEWALTGFKTTYERYNIRFDREYYESDIYEDGKQIILDNSSVFSSDETGAYVAKLERFNLPDKIVLRSDGTSIYITQDIALTLQKIKDFKPDLQIWVVAHEQDMHFKQLFAILELLGYSKEQFHHLSYGLVGLPEGRMKSREGRVVDADDILDELETLAKDVITESHSDWSEEKIAKIGRAVALAAIRFYMLKFDPVKDFTFDPKSSINFEGDTGPYLQYTCARINSILAKTQHPNHAEHSVLQAPEEQALLRAMLALTEAYRKAVHDYKPNILATQLLVVARAFNTFYHACPVLQAPPSVREARLHLITAVKHVLSKGLELLGISVVDEL